jgi:hypothetical protein
MAGLCMNGISFVQMTSLYLRVIWVCIYVIFPLQIFVVKWMRECFSPLFQAICWFLVVVKVIFDRWYEPI